jgi:integral membrane sensor domain MASE1
MLSAFAGALALHAMGDDYWVAWQRWYLGAAVASLIITPMIMYWALGGVEAVRSASSKRRVEAILLCGALILVGIFALSGGVEGLGNPSVLIYLPFPLLLYAAVRFGPRGASTALSLIAAAAIWYAEHGQGPFSGESSGGGILSLQLFLCVTAIPLLCVQLYEESVWRRRSGKLPRDWPGLRVPRS